MNPLMHINGLFHQTHGDVMQAHLDAAGVLAYNARVTEAHLDTSARFPKGARALLAPQVYAADLLAARVPRRDNRNLMLLEITEMHMQIRQHSRILLEVLQQFQSFPASRREIALSQIDNMGRFVSQKPVPDYLNTIGLAMSLSALRFPGERARRHFSLDEAFPPAATGTSTT